MKYRKRRPSKRPKTKRRRQKRGRGVLLTEEQHKKAANGLNGFINTIKNISNAFTSLQRRKELLKEARSKLNI